MIAQWALFLAFAGTVVGTHFVVNRVFLHLHVVRRLNLAVGGMGKTRLESKLAVHSAGIRSVASGALVVLGGLLPLGEDDREKLATGLQRAGFRSNNAVAVVLGAKAACLIAGLAAGLTLLPPLMPGLLGWGIGLIGGLLCGVLVNLVPELVVARLGTARMNRIRGGLADAFDLLIVCLESRLTFDRALQRTVADLRSFRPDLAIELRQASLDMSVHGRSRLDALGRLAERLDIRELRDLAATVFRSERHGTPLADSLRKMGDAMRVQAYASIQARNARLPILLILPTIVFLLPGIMVIVGGPVFTELVRSLDTFGL